MASIVRRGVCVLAFLSLAGAASAEGFRLEKRFDLAIGGAFALRSEVGGVTVHGGDGTQAVVVVTAEREDFAEQFDVRFDAQPERLGVTIERRARGFFSWFGGFRGRVSVEVELPRRVTAKVESSGGGVEVAGLEGPVTVESSGGAVEVADVERDAVLSSSGGHVHAERIHGALRAESSGGGVEARQIGGKADLESSGGGIVAEDIDGDLEASSSGGGVRIEEAHGAVVAESSGGPVRVGFAAGNARGGSLDSSGGGVQARVDPAVGLEIDASSSGGRVSSDLPVTVRGRIGGDSLRGELNAGGSLLKLRSSGGGITLAPR